MLSDRIATLFSLLQCTNTDIARFAGCSSGNISKLKTGNRKPAPASRSIQSLVHGIYAYADYENLLPVLAELCNQPDTSRETLIPALTRWLYETRDIPPLSRSMTPRTKQGLVRQRQTFGARLDQAMTLLDLSNGQLASLLNLDASMVSRYRAGLYSPLGNIWLSERLAAVLLDRAGKKGLLSELGKLCSGSSCPPDGEIIFQWLYETPAEDTAEFAQRLLQSLDAFSPEKYLPPAAPTKPHIETASCYWGTAGLRKAVVRLLSDAARQGGELLLYSDEPMDWMTGDEDYIALWTSLMAACVRNGVRIRIIHNLDRSWSEMINAIRDWLPLYISGMIEPYVFSRIRNARFCHTVFLLTGGACIHGFFPSGAVDRWYDYLTEKPKLKAMEGEYREMLSAASPFLKTFTPGSDAFPRFLADRQGSRTCLLSALPVVTMPEGLLAKMLSRTEISDGKRVAVLDAYRDMRRHFSSLLRQGSVNMLLCPEGIQSQRVNFSLDLIDLVLDYTPEEYAEHLSSVALMVEEERNFHMTLLPETPFRDLQLVTVKDAVAVLRCREPFTAFVFLNPVLTESVSAYLSMLTDQYAEDRRTVAERLRLCGSSVFH